MSSYKRKFYESTRENMVSAAEVVPVVMELAKPRSVVDLGCGVGGWLAAFKEAGVEDITGYDGQWVHRDDLVIPESRFHCHDLTTPLEYDRVFDLAVSVEVAEHLPPECAPLFVRTLTVLSRVVLFSAAIPFQGGTNHINEQWPVYWIELFKQHGFLTVDCLRLKFWNNPRVKWWYAQNMMLFVSETELGKYPALMDAFHKQNLSGVSLVHPRRWENQADPRNLRLGKTIKRYFSLRMKSLMSRLCRRPATDQGALSRDAKTVR